VTNAQLEIICTECGADTLILRSPRYDGFTRVGDTLKCAACGHEYESEDTAPFKEARSAPDVFGAADKSTEVDVFSEDKAGRLCRYCAHYIVNPFTQKCGRHFKIVEATDTCADFKEKEVEEESPSTGGPDGEA
jgi:rRNA maturation protein Nop10